jgi:hypothetical protein
MRYFEPAKGSPIYCSKACKLSHWKRRQAESPSPLKAYPMGLSDVMTERAPAPYLAGDSAQLVDDLIATLGTVRGLQWVGDSGAMLHLLASMTAEIESRMPAAVAGARDQLYSWAEISALAGASRERVLRLAALHRACPPGGASHGR